MKAITIDITNDSPLGLGEKEYASQPRRGEWVEIEIDDKAAMFEVVKVAHSSTGNGSDIFVKRIAETVDAIHDLCKST